MRLGPGLMMVGMVAGLTACWMGGADHCCGVAGSDFHCDEVAIASDGHSITGVGASDGQSIKGVDLLLSDQPLHRSGSSSKPLSCERSVGDGELGGDPLRRSMILKINKKLTHDLTFIIITTTTYWFFC